MKKYTSVTLSIIFVMSMSDCVLSKDNHQKKDDKFSGVSSFFDDFDRWMYGDEKAKGVSQKTHDFFKEAEKEVSSMMHELQETARHLRDRSLKHAKQAFKKTSDLMRKGATRLDQLNKDIAADLKKTEQAKQYNVHEYTDDKKNIYGVKITLPHIKKDDIKTTITDTKIESGVIKSLQITAEEKTKEPGINRSFSRQMYSRSIINGKQKETSYKIDYKDGVVTITINLPDTIDEENYTMKFDDEKLIVEFAQSKKKNRKKRRLKFTD